MSSSFLFRPNPQRSARENVEAFVAFCKDKLTVFGRELRWEDNNWKPPGVSFGNLDQTTRSLDPKNLMKEPFRSFAKAYFRYQQGLAPTKSRTELQALRCIERALEHSGMAPEVPSITLATLDLAAKLAQEHYSPGAAYRTGGEIERLAKFITDKQLVRGRIDWRSPLKRPDDVVRTGTEAKIRREAKLPSSEALDALAEIFASNPKIDRDIFTTSATAMLLAAPSRGSALLCLLEQCEIAEQKRDGSPAYGWRFPSDKGAQPSIKWIPDVFADVAKEAIARIRAITDEGRRLAKWLESHPEEFYRHSKCPDLPEDQALSVTEVAAAIGIGPKDEQYCRYELKRLGFSTEPFKYTLRSLNQWVHTQLPEHFPWLDRERGVKYSNALFCFRAKQLRTDMPASPVVLAPININILNNDLCSRETKPGYITQSIFDRYGYDRPEQPLKLTSHQFRHLLNTIAQRGGLSQSEIARWAGRVDTKQNRAYDHMSEFELVDMLRSHDARLTLDRPLEEIAHRLAKLIPITRQEFNTLTTPTAHITEFGFCVHDFVMAPCQRFRDCLNCTEQVCIKGDRRIDRIRARYAQVMELKERAEREIASGSWGADRWYEIHDLTAKRLSELISILESADVPDGAIVRLRNDHEFSRVRMVLESKRKRKTRSTSQNSRSKALVKTDGKASH